MCGQEAAPSPEPGVSETSPVEPSESPSPAADSASKTTSSVSIEEISGDHAGKKLEVHGEVIYVIPPLTNRSKYVVLLKDNTTGTLRLIVPEAVWNKIPFQSEIQTEARVEADAEITQLVSSADAGKVVWASLLSPSDIRLGDVRPQSVPEIKAEQKAQAAVAHAKATAAKGRWIWIALAAVVLFVIGMGVLYSRRRRIDGAPSPEDIAERERAKKALQEGMARVEHLLNAGPSVIYSLRPPDDCEASSELYRLTYISDSVSRILGYTSKECMSDPSWWIDNVHPDDRPVVEQAAWESINKTGSFEREYRFRHRDGQYRYLHDHQRLLCNEQDVPYEILGTWSDVTERAKSARMRMIFASLGQRLSAITNKEEASRVALRVADELFGWDCSYVSLYSPNESVLTGVVTYDLVKGRRREVAKVPGVPVTSLTRGVLEGGARLIVRGGEHDQEVDDLKPFGENRRSASLMFAPIRKGGIGFGIFSIQSYSATAYRQEDLGLLQLLADYCGAALERTMAEELRKEAEERYALALRGANDGLWDWDLRTNRLYYSPRWKAMIGCSEEEISDSPNEWIARINENDLERVKADITSHIHGRTEQLETQFRMMHKDGIARWVLMRGVAVRDATGEAYRMAGSLTDVTMRKRAEEQLMHGAYYDALTGLPNRLLFTEQLRRAVSRCKRRPEHLFAVLFIDLDRFKIINDSLGHLVGDQLLVNVAVRLKKCVRPEDTVARLGGDEFTILLEDIADPSHATRVAERIQEELVKPVNLSSHDVYSTASIGIAFSSTGYEKAEDILRDADAAMYRAKQKGKARHELFDSDMHERALEVLRLEADLRRAVEREEFRVVYQPFVCVKTGRISGFEALARWEHPTRGMVSPADFIPLAEENGLIVPIGWSVLRQACSQVNEWQSLRRADEPLSVSVNFSRKQFAQPDLVKTIESILTETGLNPTCLALEITESVLMENAQALDSLLGTLKAMGMQLHIDDFGTGYSSLSYLHRFPIDTLKIDRSFISRIHPDGHNAEIIRAIINMASSLGIKVVAEGVETEEQLKVLKELSCDLVQGFLLNRPLSPEEAVDVLAGPVLPAAGVE